jgi:hypothetical protein
MFEDLRAIQGTNDVDGLNNFSDYYLYLNFEN